MPVLKCEQCGVTLQSQIGLCPNCGSDKKQMKLTIENTLSFTDSKFRARLIDKGKSTRNFIEEYLRRKVIGRKSGKPATETRIIDRGRNKYKKHIETEDGFVEHHVEEKLTDHKKPKKKKP